MTSNLSGENQTEIDDLNRREAALIARRDLLLTKFEQARERLSSVLICGDENDPNAAATAERALANIENALNAAEDEIVKLVEKLEHAKHGQHSSHR